MSNVFQAAWQHAESDPARIAIRGAGEAWSYGQLRDRAAAVAGRLNAAGVRPGDRVLLVAPSVPAFAGAYYGIHAAGAVAVTANTMSTRRELEYLAADAGVSLVLAWHEIQSAPQETAKALSIPCWPLDDELSDFASAPARGGPAVRGPGDDAVILYTSGTTGRPKGARLTHGNLVACAEIFAEVFEAGPGDRAGTALPLFHVFGQAVTMGTLLRVGGEVSLLARFDAVDLLAMLRRDRLTLMSGVPTMWNALLQTPERSSEREDFAALRVAVSGGAAMPADVMRAFERRFGCVILEGYGLSETTGAATFNGLHRVRKPSSVGVTLPRCEVEIRDPDGTVVTDGAVGELYVRGPVVMRGYWNRPEATEHALVDGWMRSGDLGTRDADGDIRVVDRQTDLIIRGGYNVYPREVEEVLQEHPDIIEVAVIGIPDAHFGEEVAAVIALRAGANLEPKDLRAWAKIRLSAYKVPRLFHVVDALPQGATGKILKRAIDRAEVRAKAVVVGGDAKVDRGASTGEDLVLAERRGAVLVLTLNRPDRLNAWNDALEQRYFELLADADGDPDVRAIIVTGAGRGFCAGADMDDLEQADDVVITAALGRRDRPRHFPRTIRKPLIGAINGAAAGLGLVEALYCDVRFCARDAKLTTAFARRGLIAEYGISWLLPRLVGPSAATDLLLSARVVLGDEAHQLGLVDHVAERGSVLDDAVAYAQDLAEHCSPSSMAVMKEQLRSDAERGFAEAVAAADTEMVASFSRTDVAEGVASYVAKRPPAFAPLARAETAADGLTAGR